MDRGILVIEQPPQVRSVSWADQAGYQMDREDFYSGGRKKIEKFKLAFPFIILVCEMFEEGTIDEVRVFYRNLPLRSLQDELYHTNLGNVSTADCKICLGESSSFRGSVEDQAGEILNRLWNSCFNADIKKDEFELSKRLSKKIASLEAWKKATAEDELFPLSIRWRKTGKTIGDIIKEKCRIFAEEDDGQLNSFDDLLDVFYRCCPGSTRWTIGGEEKYEEDRKMQGGDYLHGS